jgi:hypothetical protein
LVENDTSWAENTVVTRFPEPRSWKYDTSDKYGIKVRQLKKSVMFSSHDVLTIGDKNYGTASGDLDC